MAHVVGTAWSTGFFPGLFGLGALKPRLGLPVADPPLEPTSALVVIVAQLVLLAIDAVAVWRRPATWRLWALFVFAFAANQLYMGYGRGHTGTVIGREYRYMVDLAPLFAIVVAWSFGRVTRPAGSPLGAAPRQLPRRFIAAASALIACGLVFQVVREFQGGDGIRSEFPVSDTRHYVKHFRHDIDRIQRTVAHPALFDAPMPGIVMTGGFGQYAGRSSFLPVLADGLRFGTSAPRMYDVGEDGHVYPARVPAQGALDTAAPIRVTGATKVRRSRGALCLSGQGTVHLPLRLADGPFSSQRTQLVLRYRAPVSSPTELYLTSDAGESDAFTNYQPLPITAGAHTYVRHLRDDTLTSGLRLDLDPTTRVCIESLRIGKPVALAAPGTA